MLTIAIPTFNRASRLQTQIECLLPQLRSGVRLCIYDNGSTDETRNVVEKYVERGIFYIRGETNCGGSRNFFRCMEDCSTEWLWLLSDDDPAAPDAVDNLLGLLSNCPCDFVYTSSPFWSFESEGVISTVPDLLKNARFPKARLSLLFWLSCCVYRIPSFRTYFKLYNNSISTMVPQMLVVLAMLEAQSGKVWLSKLQLFLAPSHAVEWSTLDFIARVSHAPEYLEQPLNQKLLADCILFENYDSALLTGLRETDSPDKIRKWRRIGRIARHNLRAFRASRHWPSLLWNCCKPGPRKEYLKVVAKMVLVKILRACPVFLFHPLLKVLPLPSVLRNAYSKRDKFVPYS